MKKDTHAIGVGIFASCAVNYSLSNTQNRKKDVIARLKEPWQSPP